MNRRLVTLALLAFPVALARAEDGPAPAPAPKEAIPDTVTVGTEAVPNDAVPTLTPGAPSKRTGFFAAQPSLQVEFEATGVQDGQTVLEGALEAGNRKLPITLMRSGTDGLTLLADFDGDGTTDPAKERLEVKGVPWTSGTQVLGMEWAFPDGVSLGGHPVLVHVRERAAGLAAQAIVPAARRGDRPEETHALALAADAPTAVKSMPTATGRPSFATATIAGQDVLIAVVRGEGDALDLVWADAGKGDLAGGSKVPMTGTPMVRNKKRIGTRWQAAPVALGAKQVVFTVVENLANVQAMVNAPATRRATATIDGQEWLAFLLDADLDGAYTGPLDLWWFGPREETVRPNPNNMTEGNEPRFLACGAWRLTGVDEAGAATFARAGEDVTFEDYARRRTERVNTTKWFPRFAEDKDFAVQRKLDASRPRAEHPVEFRFARDLAEALELAKQEGKPLLVDFEADWCVWCKRLDYNTYPDREVNDWLAKFTAVKINKDLDPSRSFDTLKDFEGNPWRGIPAVGVFGADGAPIPFELAVAADRPPLLVDHIPGWMRPEDFAAALAAAYAQAERVKAGEPRLTPSGHGTKPPAEKPAEAPAEKPSEKPAEAPTEKPAPTAPDPK